MPISSPRYATLVSCCVVFLFFTAVVTAQGVRMFGDNDPFWHLAAGDWTRAHHQIRDYYPWSYTANGFRWLQVSWGWDTLISIIHAHSGWYGVLMFNGLMFALTLTCMYTACLICCGDGIAAFLSSGAGLSVMGDNLRPLQVSNLLIAVWLLLLMGIVRNRIGRRWLIALPMTMVLWVNMHSGFPVGLVLLGAFFLQALWQRDIALARSLCFTGIACLVALCVNPYGVHVFDAVWTSVFSGSNKFVNDWKPLVTSSANIVLNIYAVLFVAMVVNRPLPVSQAERWLAYAWLLLGLTSIRHLSIFALVSAPVFSCRVQQFLAPKKPPTPQMTALRDATLRLCSHAGVALPLAVLCMGLSIWLPTNSGKRLLNQHEPALPNLTAELNFIREHYPHTRFFNDYNISGLWVYETGGSIPLFIDARAEIGYPASVLADYVHISRGDANWEALIAQYKIDGIVMENSKGDVIDRLSSNHNWVKKFTGPLATIFVHEPLRYE